jgi:energy-coupling factor transport system ATP-binding protein
MDGRRRRGRLDAAELAEAAVLGDLALVLALAGFFIPISGALFVAATIPYAVLAGRRRLRAVVVAAFTTGLLAFVVGGVPMVMNLAGVATMGAAVGIAYKRGYRRLGTIGTVVVVFWVPAALVTDLMLLIFSRTRALTLEQAETSVRGLARFLDRLGLEAVADSLRDSVQWSLDHWWLTIPLTELVLAIVFAIVGRNLALPALRRIDATFSRAALATPRGPAPAADAPVVPLPLTLTGVSFRYPGATVDALSNVDLTIQRNTFVAVVGDNGSGKSTLAALLAGTPPTRGEVHRPGDAGVGRTGGTAVVFQRPESQVLGARVADDVRWGVAGSVVTDDDVDALLEGVGLAGFRDRDTSTLSGGELQRLALASALARRPTLLISDESTAMLDHDGRAAVLELLLGLPAEGTTVVHVTHEPGEAERADTVVLLDGGRVRAIGVPADVLARRDGNQ